ncbi:acetyl-CoA decarbonylase/synthase complex subunit delta [Thermosulfurimonas marina]|nr:acetyl-CoA decarbonylase/synthase complex subunit delta [Thermosulfurimonas marina]
MEPRSHLQRVLSEGHFAVTAEIGPPKSADGEVVRRKARLLKGYVDAANITDCQTAIVRMSSIASAVLVMAEGVEPVIQMTCRDRNRIGIQADLLGAAALGVRNLLCITGDHQKFGNHPEAKGVFDLDSIQLLDMVRRMRDEGKFLCGEELTGDRPQFFLGAAANPFADPFEFRVKRLAKKIAAGAEFIQTQIVYNVERFRKFMEMARDMGLVEKAYILAGITPPKSFGMARYMKYFVPGLDVPDEILQRMKEAKDKREEGINLAVEIIQRVREIPGVAGVHIMAIEWEEAVPEIVKRAGLHPRPLEAEVRPPIAVEVEKPVERVEVLAPPAEKGPEVPPKLEIPVEAVKEVFSTIRSSMEALREGVNLLHDSLARLERALLGGEVVPVERVEIPRVEVKAEAPPVEEVKPEEKPPKEEVRPEEVVEEVEVKEEKPAEKVEVKEEKPPEERPPAKERPPVEEKPPVEALAAPPEGVEILGFSGEYRPLSERAAGLPEDLYKDPGTAYIREVEIGKGAKAFKVGGTNVLPFHLFEGEMRHPPRIAMEVLDVKPEDWPESLTKYFAEVLGDPAAWAKKCVEVYGAEAVCVYLLGTDPNYLNLDAKHAREVVEKVASAVEVPLIIWGAGHAEKDVEVLREVAEVVGDRGAVIGPVEEANHRTLGATAMGYGLPVVASSPIDVNLAKQLNILLENVGVSLDKILMDPSIGALGYGLEYTYSVMERIRLAALYAQDDKLQVPFVCNVGREVWKTKEAGLPSDETLGDQEIRGILMEAITSVALALAGGDLFIMRHPKAIELTKTIISGLMQQS